VELVRLGKGNIPPLGKEKKRKKRFQKKGKRKRGGDGHSPRSPQKKTIYIMGKGRGDPTRIMGGKKPHCDRHTCVPKKKKSGGEEKKKVAKKGRAWFFCDSGLGGKKKPRVSLPQGGKGGEKKKKTGEGALIHEKGGKGVYWEKVFLLPQKGEK